MALPRGHGQWCAAINCRNARHKCKGLSFFRFPKDAERSQKWVINCRRQDITNKSKDELYANYALCANHFEDSQFMNDAQKKRLIWSAVPTIFDVPNTPQAVTSSRPPPKKRVAVAKPVPSSLIVPQVLPNPGRANFSIKKEKDKAGCSPIVYIDNAEDYETDLCGSVGDCDVDSIKCEDFATDGHVEDSENQPDNVISIKRELPEAGRENCHDESIGKQDFCFTVKKEAPDTDEDGSATDANIEDHSASNESMASNLRNEENMTDGVCTKTECMDTDESKSIGSAKSAESMVDDVKKTEFVGLLEALSDTFKTEKHESVELMDNVSPETMKEKTQESTEVEENVMHQSQGFVANTGTTSDLATSPFQGIQCAKNAIPYLAGVSDGVNKPPASDMKATSVINMNTNKEIQLGPFYSAGTEIGTGIPVCMILCTITATSANQTARDVRGNSLGTQQAGTKSSLQRFVPIAPAVPKEVSDDKLDKYLNHFMCTKCGSGFSELKDLKLHKKTHAEKPYKCDICDLGFTLSGHLKNHKRTHTKKSFKCGICDKSFNKNSLMQRHKRTHTGEKPFQCKVCNRLFASSSYLTEHLRIHTGEKPFKCEV